MAKYQDQCDALAVGLVTGVPVLLWGGPGVGKTSVIEQIAAHNGWHLETVIASICDPTDFKGMPRDAGDRTVFSPPDWAQRTLEAGGGLVFLDEISTAPPSVQAALLRPVLTGVVGDVALPKSTRFVAAANPPDEASDGWDLSAPLANRFLHIEWDVATSAIADGFLFGFEPIAVPEIKPEAVAVEVERMKRSIGAFLTVRPELTHHMPKSSNERGLAWPSPRSWEMAAVVAGHAAASKASKTVRQLLIAGCVGPSAAREYLAWERNLDLPSIESLLNSKDPLSLPSTPDKLVVLCAGLVSAIHEDASRARCELAVNRVLVGMADAGHLDLATVALRRISKQVRSTKAVLTPVAMTHFSNILVKMGGLDSD